MRDVGTLVLDLILPCLILFLTLVFLQDIIRCLEDQSKTNCPVLQ